MQYTFYSLLRKHGEVMSEKEIEKSFLGHQQNVKCQMKLVKITNKYDEIEKRFASPADPL